MTTYEGGKIFNDEDIPISDVFLKEYNEAKSVEYYGAEKQIDIRRVGNRTIAEISLDCSAIRFVHLADEIGELHFLRDWLPMLESVLNIEKED